MSIASAQRASPPSQLETIRTALTAADGLVAVMGLVFAFFRQRNTERISVRDHQQRDRIAAATDKDALERRVAELYSKAAEQLCHKDAPVRLAALYSLEQGARIPVPTGTAESVQCKVRQPVGPVPQAALRRSSPPSARQGRRTLAHSVARVRGACFPSCAVGHRHAHVVPAGTFTTDGVGRIRPTLWSTIKAPTLEG